ncbi:hypothetical protein [Roseomonas xinghualingensis]|uniref:hypothetical protein n=1 Tax=Roseomonas xinghualingensis TaxID=2986475 RepID=UPI0021F18FF6|nr:hypothetical protein [Roseomonas sp. SXEYE001]MCV4207013.1 hypothetical protein [Roseomonas sp. SXEYE001]
MTVPAPEQDDPSRRAEAARVAAYLTAHPGFLAERPGLYRALHPPRRVHGENLADHMAALLHAARAETGAVAEVARAGQDLTIRAATALIALIGAPDPLAVVTAEWPELLGLECAALAREGAPSPALRDLPAGTVDRLMAGRDLVLRDAPEDAALLHGEAHPLIARDALLRLPGTAPQMLVLGAREAGRLPLRGAGAPLRLLAHALSRALDGSA